MISVCVDVRMSIISVVYEYKQIKQLCSQMDCPKVSLHGKVSRPNNKTSDLANLV